MPGRINIGGLGTQYPFDYRPSTLQSLVLGREKKNLFKYPVSVLCYVWFCLRQESSNQNHVPILYKIPLLWQKNCINYILFSVLCHTEERAHAALVRGWNNSLPSLKPLLCFFPFPLKIIVGCRRLSLDDKYALQMYSGAQKLEQASLFKTSKSDRNMCFFF